MSITTSPCDMPVRCKHCGEVYAPNNSASSYVKKEGYMFLHECNVCKGLTLVHCQPDLTWFASYKVMK
ncbi:hypothetical protein PR08_gp45 [Idiomarinaceae phage Phi1M2-2]|uniref:hypothetical protein n=1 Tax=Idiomarinaceae phage Phi1M2-2 TaxID=1527515 RepID=UPI0004F7C886|nr:hypothetical protein PR08_gp45 [Idiomarinaceae phage Phi1M2-2]AIM40802.1 hypothetical protein M22_045 [Idiomarinaceae phage Phi1M2-2]